MYLGMGRKQRERGEAAAAFASSGNCTAAPPVFLAASEAPEAVLPPPTSFVSGKRYTDKRAGRGRRRRCAGCKSIQGLEAAAFRGIHVQN